MANRGGEAGPSSGSNPDLKKVRDRGSQATNAWQPSYANVGNEKEGVKRTWILNKGKGTDGRHSVECTICPRGLAGPPYGWVFACNSKAIKQHEVSDYHIQSVERVKNDKRWAKGECWGAKCTLHEPPQCISECMSLRHCSA